MDEINSVEVVQKGFPDLASKKAKDLKAVSDIPYGENSTRKARKDITCLGNHMDDLIIKGTSY